VWKVPLGPAEVPESDSSWTVGSISFTAALRHESSHRGSTRCGKHAAPEDLSAITCQLSTTQRNLRRSVRRFFWRPCRPVDRVRPRAEAVLDSRWRCEAIRPCRIGAPTRLGWTRAEEGAHVSEEGVVVRTRAFSLVRAHFHSPAICTATSATLHPRHARRRSAPRLAGAGVLASSACRGGTFLKRIALTSNQADGGVSALSSCSR